MFTRQPICHTSLPHSFPATPHPHTPRVVNMVSAVTTVMALAVGPHRARVKKVMGKAATRVTPVTHVHRMTPWA